MTKHIIYIFFFLTTQQIISSELVFLSDREEDDKQRMIRHQMINATRNNKIDQIIKLLPQIDDVHIKTPLGTMPLHRLCDTGFKTMQNVYCSNMNAKNRSEQTKQLNRVVHGIELVLEKDADPRPLLFDTQNKYAYRNISFIFASINGHPYDTINIQNENGDTPLHSAIKKLNKTEVFGEQELPFTLLILGADTTIKNKNGETARDVTEHEYFQELLSPESVRSLQMNFYRTGKAALPLLVNGQEEPVNHSSLYKTVRDRAYGVRPTLRLTRRTGI